MNLNFDKKKLHSWIIKHVLTFLNMKDHFEKHFLPVDLQNTFARNVSFHSYILNICVTIKKKVKVIDVFFFSEEYRITKGLHLSLK